MLEVYGIYKFNNPSINDYGYYLITEIKGGVARGIYNMSLDGLILSYGKKVNNHNKRRFYAASGQDIDRLDCSLDIKENFNPLMKQASVEPEKSIWNL